ncbi:hypothetical protein EI94DRAFT_1751269 [Lactarius quietus]|nr:hypothetical protein EI94DRAFT_1751269 [Lactarius quietus]
MRWLLSRRLFMYRSTSMRSTRPFFPLPGASNVMTTPLYRAKWRIDVSVRTSATASWEEEALNSGAGGSFGSSGCGRRATRGSSEAPGPCETSCLRSQRDGSPKGEAEVDASKCSDASSSVLMTHRPSPTLATSPSCTRISLIVPSNGLLILILCRSALHRAHQRH